MVEFVARARLPTRFGLFDIYAFKAKDSKEHIALVNGKMNIKHETQDDQESSRPKTQNIEPVSVRIHSKCLTGDTFHSLRCDCRAQLEASLYAIGKAGGVLIYLDQEGRGIGLSNKIKAYALQEKGKDTVDANIELGFAADARDYRIAAVILKFLKIKTIRLITNNPGKLKGLEGNGITVVERIPLNVKPNIFNKRYMETKKKRLGHF